MFILIVGCGRVGSSVARTMLREGHEVSCLDEDPESHTRLEVGLEKGWEDLGGMFTVGAGLEIDALVAAGIERADAFIASTDGDNTNIVIAQIAQRRYEVPTVIARILDPLRAEWYQRQGLHTICPTRVAIEMLESAVLADGAGRRADRVRGSGLMYIIIVGAGKVGWNLARELLEKEHEVTVIESNRRRYLTVEQELEHNVLYGDASELWVLERAGVQRADMVIAVTGDDEDNILICQVAREKYEVGQIIARVNNPRNRQHFDLLGVKPSISATDLILRLLEHEVPEYGLVHLLDLQEEQLEIIEMLLGKDSRVTGRRVGDLSMPDGSLLISVLRDGKGFVPGPDTVLEAGDEVLAVLDPGREDELKDLFGPGGERGRRDGRRSADFLLIGGGLASGHCASELRKRGADGSILLVGREPEPPYERPPLSKEYLRGEASREDAYVNPASWYEENEVELLSGVNVMSLDADARTATLQGGERVAFGKALLGTGAMVNILRVEGAENEGIHYLRAFGNSDAIRADAEAAEHVVLIGGSYIGTEVAASLTAKGVKCTIVMMEDVTLSRTFGEDAGRWFQETIEGHGVTVHGGEELEAFEGDGRVRAVVTKSGLAIECDTVIVGAGVRPDTMLAERAGLAVENGITCDSKLQTSLAGRLRGRRLLLLRERRPRPPPPRRALGRRDAAGDARRQEHARRGRATTTSSPTSSATSRTGRASSTSAPPTSGTRGLAR